MRQETSLMEQETINTGRGIKADHVAIIKVTNEVSLSAGFNRYVNTYIVRAMNFNSKGKQLESMYQYDTLIKAERKFNRLTR